MESIDRLRQAADELAQRAMPCSNAPDYADVRWKVKQLADAIEREVDDMWHALTIDMKPMTDENMAEDGWIRLPKDADGEYIHVGDVMDTEHFGTVEVEGFVHRAVAFYNYSGQPAYLCTAPANLCRHHHAPTVEDVLREFALACEDAGNAGPEVERIAAEYAAKLRLAGDE